MNEPGWISLLPTVLAIVLAIWSRQVYVSLAAGIWIGWTILEAGTRSPASPPPSSRPWRCWATPETPR